MSSPDDLVSAKPTYAVGVDMAGPEASRTALVVLRKREDGEYEVIAQRTYWDPNGNALNALANLVRQAPTNPRAAEMLEQMDEIPEDQFWSMYFRDSRI